MTDLNKRSMFKLAAISALTVTALAACGKKMNPHLRLPQHLWRMRLLLQSR